MAKNAPLTMGIEEEYLLVDPRTRDLANDPPPEFMEDCRKELGERVCPEFLRSQVEIGTPVCQNIQEARTHLTDLRRVVRDMANKHGLMLMAASTHPFALWSKQSPTQADRYETLARDMQGAIRRMLICGMHVHIGIEDPDLRVDLMNQVAYFMPHLLALSTSSPFWGAQQMGMRSYRLAVFDGMPRTGIPEQFTGWSDYERLINRMVKAGAVEDASKLWWDLRPSSKFPTLEMRVTDICTRVEDALAIAALYQCLLSMLIRLRRNNQRWRNYPRLLVEENRWLAQRHGVKGRLIDLGKEQMGAFPELLEEILELVQEDAEALGCVDEINHTRKIAQEGTSADRQLKAYQDAVDKGVTPELALRGVVDLMVAETSMGL